MKSISKQTLELAILLLIAFAVSPAGADSLRCGGHLVGTGERMFMVRKLCGEPDIVVVLSSAYTVDFGFLPYDEEWQYNFGPQKFMRFLRFRNGRLSSIQTGPHGFISPSGKCKPFEISEGLSILELLNRCGEPMLIERRIAEYEYRLGPAGPFFPVGTPVEDWIYDFGRNQFYRIVTVIDGKVIEIVSSDHRG
ncbi:MAG TPA: DUF2845 domain-containing protein [Gammaproteobacteria bacterium]